MFHKNQKDVYRDGRGKQSAETSVDISQHRALHNITSKPGLLKYLLQLLICRNAYDGAWCYNNYYIHTCFFYIHTCLPLPSLRLSDFYN